MPSVRFNTAVLSEEFERNKLPAVSITFAVYSPIQFTDDILFVLIKLAPVIDPPPGFVDIIEFAIILFALIKLAPVIEPPKPVPPDTIVFAIILPALILCG